MGETFQYCQQAGVKVRSNRRTEKPWLILEQRDQRTEASPQRRAILEQAIISTGTSARLLQVAAMPRVLEHLRAAEALAETLGDQRRLTSISRR